MKTFPAYALLLSLLASLLLPAAASAAEPTANTRQGVLEGSRRESLEVFLGVPFAAPPVGAMRWSRYWRWRD